MFNNDSMRIANPFEKSRGKKYRILDEPQIESRKLTALYAFVCVSVLLCFFGGFWYWVELGVYQNYCVANPDYGNTPACSLVGMQTGLGLVILGLIIIVISLSLHISILKKPYKSTSLPKASTGDQNFLSANISAYTRNTAVNENKDY